MPNVHGAVSHGIRGLEAIPAPSAHVNGVNNFNTEKLTL